VLARGDSSSKARGGKKKRGFKEGSVFCGNRNWNQKGREKHGAIEGKNWSSMPEPVTNERARDRFHQLSKKYTENFPAEEGG